MTGLPKGWETAESSLAESYLRISPADRVLLYGNAHLLGVYESLRRVIERRGATVWTVCFTDAELESAIREDPVALGAACRLCFPEFEGGRVDSSRGVLTGISKSVVGVFPIADLDRLVGRFGTEGRTIVDHMFQLLQERSIQPLIRDQSADVVLLDLPPALWAARCGLDPEIAREAVATAITVRRETLARWERERIGDLAGAKEIRIRTANGTDLRLGCRGRSWRSESVATRKVVQLPCGEVWCPFEEDSATGEVVVEANLSPIRRRARFRFESGRAMRLEGEDVVHFEKVLGIPGERLGEIGIGSNPSVQIDRIPLGATLEKARGTIHIALGTNVFLGGTYQSTRHVDMGLDRPTLEKDGVPLMIDGDWIRASSDALDREASS